MNLFDGLQLLELVKDGDVKTYLAADPQRSRNVLVHWMPIGAGSEVHSLLELLDGLSSVWPRADSGSRHPVWPDVPDNRESDPIPRLEGMADDRGAGEVRPGGRSAAPSGTMAIARSARPASSALVSIDAGGSRSHPAAPAASGIGSDAWHNSARGAAESTGSASCRANVSRTGAGRVYEAVPVAASVAFRAPAGSSATAGSRAAGTGSPAGSRGVRRRIHAIVPSTCRDASAPCRIRSRALSCDSSSRAAEIRGTRRIYTRLSGGIGRAKAGASSSAACSRRPQSALERAR